VQTSANGVQYNEDQFGGVTSYTHEFADGMLTTTVGLAGSPKGRYTTWKRIGSGAGASRSIFTNGTPRKDEADVALQGCGPRDGDASVHLSVICGILGRFGVLEVAPFGGSA